MKLLAWSFCHVHGKTYSKGGPISKGEACRGLGATDVVGDSNGVLYGDGEFTSISVVTTKAGL